MVQPEQESVSPDFQGESKINFNQPLGGSTIEPLYTSRKMRAFSVTESELNMLSVINGIAALCFSIGTGLLGLSVDIQKDLLLASEVPANAETLRDLVRPALLWGAGIFYFLGVVTFFWRRATLDIIKKEVADNMPRRKGWLICLWPPGIHRMD